MPLAAAAKLFAEQHFGSYSYLLCSPNHVLAALLAAALHAMQAAAAAKKGTFKGKQPMGSSLGEDVMLAARPAAVQAAAAKKQQQQQMTRNRAAAAAAAATEGNVANTGRPQRSRRAT